MPDEIDNNQPGPDGTPPEPNDSAGKDEPTPANHDADEAPQGPEAGQPLSSESSGSPDGTRLRCRYCNQLNQIRVGVVTAGSNIRCGRCRMPLSEEPHKKFTSLDPHSYIHPLDSQALKALQMIPGIDPILKKLLEVTGESILRIMFMANGVRVTEKQCPDLNAKLEVVCSTLGVEKPELYLSVTNPLAGGGGLGFNAFTSGVERPFIVVFSPLIERLDDDEVLAVLAHEVGHIHSQHLLYKVAAQLLLLLTERAVELSPIPPGIAGLITYPIRAALFTWYQKAELSCDRAAQLVVQDVNVITRVMLKLGGGLMNSKVDHEEFIKQAREFDRMVSASFIDNFWTSLLAAERTHPFPVWRVSEILKWTEDPEGYAKVLEDSQKAASATP